MNYSKPLLVALLCTFSAAAGWWASPFFEKSRQDVPSIRSHFSYDKGTGWIEFYTFYVGKDGQEVLHGWRYWVKSGMLEKTLYDHGHGKALETVPLFHTEPNK